MKIAIILVLGLVAVSDSSLFGLDIFTPIRNFIEASTTSTAAIGTFHQQLTNASTEFLNSVNILINDARTQRQNFTAEARAIFDSIAANFAAYRSNVNTEIVSRINSLTSVVTNFVSLKGIECLKNSTAFHIIINNFNSTVYDHWSVYRTNISAIVNETCTYLSIWRNTTRDCNQQANSTLVASCLKTQVQYLYGNVSEWIGEARSARNSSCVTALNDLNTLANNLKTCSV